MKNIIVILGLLTFLSACDSKPEPRWDVVCTDGKTWKNVRTNYSGWTNLIAIIMDDGRSIAVSTLKCIRSPHPRPTKLT